MQAETGPIDRPPLAFKSGINPIDSRPAGEDGLAAVDDMIRVERRGIPNRHHGVANEFVHGTVRGHDRIRKLGEIGRRLGYHLLGPGMFDDRSEVRYVGEQDRDFPPHTAKTELISGFDQLPDEVLGHIIGERLDYPAHGENRAAEVVDFLDDGAAHHAVTGKEMLDSIGLGGDLPDPA